MKWLSKMARERRDAFIIAEYKNNVSIEAIARALNVSKSTVQKVLRRVLEKPVKRPDQIERERRNASIVEQYKNNVPIKAIARALNVSKSTVQKVLHRSRESFKVGSELNESK